LAPLDLGLRLVR